MPKQFSRSLRRLAAPAILSSVLATAPISAEAEQRCTRDATRSDITRPFVPRSDGTVTDEQTGLQWKRCAEGQSWAAESSTCAGPASRQNWPRALALAEADRFLGYADWRLPTLDELRGIVEPDCTEPAIDLAMFPGTPSYAFWSATPFEYFDRLAWAVYFDSGKDGYSPRDYGLFHVRLVRDR
jgi:hypothetical protein